MPSTPSTPSTPFAYFITIIIIILFISSTILCSTTDIIAKHKLERVYDRYDNYDRYFDGNCVNKITDNIYISNYNASLDYAHLKSLGIKQILSVGLELPRHDTPYFKTMHLPLDDIPTENISKHFHNAHKFMNTAPTLVHCYAGISRSATIVISYLMKYHGVSLDAALRHCRSIRPIINPNKGFINQLKKYEKEII